MKILFIHPDVRDYRIELFERLNQEYNIDFLFTGRNNRSKEFKKTKKWNIIYTPYQQFIGYDKTFSLRSLKYIFSKKYEIIIASGLASFTTHIALIAKLFNKKKKLILWDETWDWPNTFFAKIATSYVKQIVRKADACIAAGTKAKELYLNFGAKQNKIFIAPNSAIDFSKENMTLKEVEDKKYSLGLKGKKVILYLSRIVKYKGLDYLIKAFEEILKKDNNTFLLIGGDGPFRDYCETLAKEKKINNYKFIGNVQHDKVSEYYNLCDVFVLPSRKLNDKHECSEAWGLVLNEVMSIGKPVVSTTAVAAAYDLIKQGQNGYMVKEKDCHALKKSIQTIINSKDKITNMSKNSKKIILNFTANKQFKGFKEAIENVLN